MHRPGLLLSLLFACSGALAAPATAPPRLDDGWPVTGAAARGWNTATLAAMESAIATGAAPGTTSVVIAHDGRLSPCNLDTNLDLAMGNIMDDSVEAIYYGDRATELRGRTGCGNPLTPCSTCSDANNWSANETFTRPVELRITA